MITYEFQGCAEEMMEMTFCNLPNGSCEIVTVRPNGESFKVAVKAVVNNSRDTKMVLRKLFIDGFKNNNQKIKEALTKMFGASIYRVKDMAFTVMPFD